MRGGDGDDVVAGGPGNDRIIGDSGDDVLIGELFEFIDATASDVTRGDLTSPPYGETRSQRQLRDPIAVIGVDVVDLGIGEINIGDPLVAQRIADKLGVTIQTLVDGSMKFSSPVTATDLAAITELDLSNLNLENLSGVQHLVGLEFLDLGRNQLTSSELAILRPAAAGARGLPNLRYLNLERNRIKTLDDLSTLTSLRAINLSHQRDLAITDISPLSVLDQLVFVSVAGNQVEDLTPLANLSNLRVLDVSGNPFFVASAPSVALQSLLGSVAADASSINADSTWNVHQSDDALGGSYLALGPDDDGIARWIIDGLERGSTYELFASWHGAASHSDVAKYYLDGETIGSADQRIASNGRSLGDASLSLIGTFVAESVTAEISVGSAIGNGITIADAILLRPVGGSPADSLVHLDVRGTVLSNEDRAVVLGEVIGRGGIVHVDDNQSPVWSGLPGGISVALGDATAIDDLNAFVSDPEGTSLTFAAVSSDPAVTILLDGTSLKIAATSNIKSLVNVELTATDAAGLRSTVVIPVAIGLPLIAGIVTDEKGDPIEGVTVLAEMESGVVSILTGRDGRYRVVADLGEVRLSVDLQDRFEGSMPGEIELRYNGPEFTSGQNFILQRGVAISGNVGANEGDLVSLTATPATLGGDYKWIVSGGPLRDVQGAASENFEFTPSDSGVYIVEVQYTFDAVTFVDRAVHSFGEVVGMASDNANQTVPEGRFAESLTIVDDGGDADLYEITVDYGNGTSRRSPTTKDASSISIKSIRMLEHITLLSASMTVAKSAKIRSR